MHKLKIDTVIDLELFSRCTAVISYLSGARNRVGFYKFTYEGVYRGSFLTHGLPYNDQRHIASSFLDLVLSLNVESKEIPVVKRPAEKEQLTLKVPLFVPTEKDIERAKSLFTVTPEMGADCAIVLVNPDPGVLPLRGWPVSFYSQLCRQLIAEHSNVIIGVIGLARARDFYQEISQGLDTNRLLDLTGKTANIHELLSLFYVSTVLVSSDSGAPHIASMTHIRSIALFGPETPIRYAPLHLNQRIFFANYSCSPCLSAFNHRRSHCNNNRCMQAILPAEVYQEVVKYIAPSVIYPLPLVQNQ